MCICYVHTQIHRAANAQCLPAWRVVNGYTDLMEYADHRAGLDCDAKCLPLKAYTAFFSLDRASYPGVASAVRMSRYCQAVR
jgi:hypothetical protein